MQAAGMQPVRDGVVFHLVFNLVFRIFRKFKHSGRLEGAGGGDDARAVPPPYMHNHPFFQVTVRIAAVGVRTMRTEPPHESTAGDRAYCCFNNRVQS